ncbi:choline kinase [Scheffersomyces xylosifermentans]|uniref:choline kinase n=1 Tax=Scheffersomyces xylosifermentans TaxID=1304137 RepID=UPI00315D712A
MDITPANISASPRSRSRSRTRNSTANSRSTSSTRRPSIGKRSLSSSSLTKLVVTPTTIDHDKSIPTVHATLDNTLPLDFFKQDLLSLIKTLLANLIVNRISGALTNSIYKIEYYDAQQNLQLPALLLRVYGRNVDSLIDRESELATLIKLSHKRIGPRLLGIFTNSRFEQFLDGFITLNKAQIRDEVISQMLVRRMKDLHYKIELDEEDSTAESLRPNIFEAEYLPGYIQNNFDPKDVFFVEFSRFKEIVLSYKEFLFDKYDKDSFSSNYKFCHNDTQYGNLLLHESFNPEDIIVDTPVPSTPTDESIPIIKSTSNKKDSNLVVIDFEYSGSNFPAFDLVNHFSEWMADYHDPEKSYYIHEDQYPSQLEQLNLIKSYIEYDFQYPSSGLKLANAPELLSSETTDASALVQFEIKKMYNECVYWRSTVQIFWCLWGLIQNGPLKPSSPGSPNPNGTAEAGIDSTYNIITGMDNLNLDEVIVEEAISSSDDDFDYLKYSQQKIAIIIGDFIKFGLIKKDEVDEKYWPIIKYLDTTLLEL